MDFDLSKPQKLLKDSARELLARQCKPERVRELMETETAHDDKLWREIADQGWTGLIIPEEHGGLGLGLLEMAVVAEEIGRACLPGPFLSTLFSAALITRAGSPKRLVVGCLCLHQRAHALGLTVTREQLARRVL